jgi:hypothetical protein
MGPRLNSSLSNIYCYNCCKLYRKAKLLEDANGGNGSGGVASRGVGVGSSDGGGGGLNDLIVANNRRDCKPVKMESNDSSLSTHSSSSSSGRSSSGFMMGNMGSHFVKNNSSTNSNTSCSGKEELINN